MEEVILSAAKNQVDCSVYAKDKLYFQRGNFTRAW